MLPNIVYLHAHDAGRYVEPYGHPLQTPNLMRFAQQSTLFRKAFSVSPTCGPSRSAMLTGSYPHQIGMLGLTGQGWRLNDTSQHLAHQLREEGYLTVLGGCQHEAPGDDESLMQLGYELLLNENRPAKGEFYCESVDHVERFLSKQHDRPFFLSIGTDEPHRNNKGREEIGVGNEGHRFSKNRYYDPDRLDWRYTAPPPFLPDLPVLRKEMAGYAFGVKVMDEYMGRVLDALEHYGLADNTLVIVTSDHGIEFPGAKMSLTDQGVGVMLMMRGPGIDQGQVIEPIVSHMDLYPTILDYLGLERRPWLEGSSLLPLMRGEVESLHQHVFAEQTWHCNYLEPLRSIRTERYKLVLRHLDHGPHMRHVGLSTPVMAKRGYYDRPIGHEELFDLHLDPWEACNRINDPAYAQTAEELRNELNTWMRQTGDCFPSSKFPSSPHNIP